MVAGIGDVRKIRGGVVNLDYCDLILKSNKPWLGHDTGMTIPLDLDDLRMKHELCSVCLDGRSDGRSFRVCKSGERNFRIRGRFSLRRPMQSPGFSRGLWLGPGMGYSQTSSKS